MQAKAMGEVVPANKAAYRGVSHHFAAVGAATAGLMLVADAPNVMAQRASSIYAVALTLMFTASAGEEGSLEACLLLS